MLKGWKLALGVRSTTRHRPCESLFTVTLFSCHEGAMVTLVLGVVHPQKHTSACCCTTIPSERMCGSLIFACKGMVARHAAIAPSRCKRSEEAIFFIVLSY